MLIFAILASASERRHSTVSRKIKRRRVDSEYGENHFVFASVLILVLTLVFELSTVDDGDTEEESDDDDDFYVYDVSAISPTGKYSAKTASRGESHSRYDAEVVQTVLYYKKV